jgi:hypothetical protein
MKTRLQNSEEELSAACQATTSEPYCDMLTPPGTYFSSAVFAVLHTVRARGGTDAATRTPSEPSAS